MQALAVPGRGNDGDVAQFHALRLWPDAKHLAEGAAANEEVGARPRCRPQHERCELVGVSQAGLVDGLFNPGNEGGTENPVEEEPGAKEKG